MTEAIFDHAHKLGDALNRLESATRQGLLASGLGQLAAMLRVEIALASARTHLTLGRQILLGPIHSLVSGLSATLASASSHHQDDISRVYAYTDHLFQSAALPILQAVSTWLLDRITVRVLIGWETWLGMVRSDATDQLQWPTEFDQLYQPLWKECGLERVQERSGQDSTGSEASTEIRFTVLSLFLPSIIVSRMIRRGVQENRT